MRQVFCSRTRARLSSVVETAPEVSVEQALAATEAKLAVARNVRTMKI
jgi:acyl CoA:acetate/3-ketoacid CoA transferase beta subunit